jgi:HD-GYP domain-containing protein (c-di-GMP phosphodiesterase class II)
MPKDSPETDLKVSVGDLQVGMYVIMPTAWDAHPFLKNRFRLSSRAQIDKIREAGLTEILVDRAKSFVPLPLPDAYPGPEGAASAETDRAEEEGPPIVPAELRAVIYDSSLPPPEKSRHVRDSAMTMMDGLFQRPTQANIRAAREAIAEVVELILTDDETAGFLNKITSYDYYTYSHSVNVGFLSVSMAKVLFQAGDGHNMYELGAGFFLHDLGKVHISPEIINKPGRLTDEEMREIRRHPSLGFKVLHEARQLTRESKTVVLQHHERDDGMGYPGKLRGKEIHLYGKICAIADVYDALTTDRPYRARMRPYDALALMKNEMIDHFQKDLFEKFVRMLV